MILCKGQLSGQQRLGTFVNKVQDRRSNFNDDVGVNSAPTLRKVFLKSESNIAGSEKFSIITSLELNEMLSQGIVGSVISILDVRDSVQYQNGHIVNALSANCTSKLMSKKTVRDCKRNGLDDCDGFVLYDQHSDLPSVTSPQMLLINYLKEERKSITFLQGGYDEFKKICNPKFIEASNIREMPNNLEVDPSNDIIIKSDDVLNAVASRILPFLFIGNEKDSADLELLTTLRITHILNVTSTSPFYFKNHSRFQYRRLPANDNHLQNLRGLYNEAFDFIDDCRSCDGQVLVHCWAGVSRSPSIVIAYILKHSNLTVNEALKLVVHKRNVIAPNINFMGQLENYYLDLNQNLEKRSVDIFTDDV